MTLNVDHRVSNIVSFIPDLLEKCKSCKKASPVCRIKNTFLRDKCPCLECLVKPICFLNCDERSHLKGKYFRISYLEMKDENGNVAYIKP